MKKQSFQLAVHCNHRIQAKDGDQNNHHSDSLDRAEAKYSTEDTNITYSNLLNREPTQ